MGDALTMPPVASIIRKSEMIRLSDARETLRAAFPIPCLSKNLPCTVSSFVKSAPTIAKITMPTSSSISVKPRRTRLSMLFVIGMMCKAPWMFSPWCG